MSPWSTSPMAPNSAAASPSYDGAPAYQGPVRLLPATPDLSLQAALVQAASLLSDRISIVSMAPAASLVKTNLATVQPEVLLLDLEFTRELGDAGFYELVGALPAQTVAVIVLPAAADTPPTHAKLAGFPQVRGVFPKPVEPSALLDQIVQLARAERVRQERTAPLLATQGTGDHARLAAPQPGQLAICVVAFKKGGVGKTTLATNLWYWLSTNIGPALIMGFDTPDDIGVQLHLEPFPNMQEFFRRPTDDGFRASVQKFHGQFEVILSPGDDVAAQTAIAGERGDAPIRDLIVKAAFMHPGYHAIVMDVPPTYDAYALRPMQFANRVLIVIEPDYQSILKAADGIRLVTQRSHETLNRDKFAVVVNRWTGVTKLSIRDIEERFRQALDGWTPPIIARLPYDEMVREHQVDGILPVTKKSAFAEGIEALGAYFTGARAASARGNGRGLKLALPRIKIG